MSFIVKVYTALAAQYQKAKLLVEGGFRLEYLTAGAGVILSGKCVWGTLCQIFRAEGTRF